MTLVSALIPTYSRAEHIAGAIGTVLNQTHDDIEAVVVNDGSTDGTHELLEDYDDDRVRVFHNDGNRGISYSFNRAADNARGEYYCILGDDDRWHPKKVEKQLAAMQDVDESYGVLGTWGVLRKNGRIVAQSKPKWHGDVYPEILGSFGLRPHSSHMIRRSSFEAVGGFDTDYHRAVDWEMCIRLAKKYKFACLPEYLVERHHHGENIPKAKYTEPYAQLEADYRAERRQYPGIDRAFRARWHRIHGWAALVEGHRLSGVRHYAEAFRSDPSVLKGLLVALSVFGPGAFDTAKELRGALLRTCRPETLPLIGE